MREWSCSDSRACMTTTHSSQSRRRPPSATRWTALTPTAASRVRPERRAHLFARVGNAGIGKARLVGELLARVATAGDARVVRGRVLPYGAGIAYWPLMEIIRDDAGITSEDDRDAALVKLDQR